MRHTGEVVGHFVLGDVDSLLFRGNLVQKYGSGHEATDDRRHHRVGELR